MTEIKILCPNDFQRLAVTTDLYDDIREEALGFAAEAGEVCGKISKVYRDHHGCMNMDERDAIKAELGDTQWFIAALAHKMGWDLQSLMEENIAKLQDRAARGVLHGSGDNR